MIEGDKKDIETLNNAMIELENMDEPLVPNGFGKRWIGCLVNKLGGDWEEVGCRGEWHLVELEGETLRISTESAWAPPLRTFRFIKSKLPSLKMYWHSEEPGMCEFWTNDADRKYFTDRYYVGMYLNDEYMNEYFASEDDILDYINSNYKTNFKTIDDAELAEEILGDGKAYINIYEIRIDEEDNLLN